jgi:hypothetical protein
MARAGAVKAGEAYVEVFSDDTPLVRGMKGLGAKLQSTGASIENIGTTAVKAGAGITALGAAVVGPLAAATKAFASAGDALNKMSARTGVSAQALSELGFAAEQSGADLGAVETSVARMQRAITEAGDGSQAMADTFAAIGLNVQRLQQLTPDQQFQEIAAAIARIPDPTQRAARAMEIFGRSGTKLLPLITSDIAALRNEARELGITIGDEDAQAAANLGDAMNRVGRSVKAVFLQMGAAVAPTVTKVLDTVKDITSAVARWISQNRELVTVVGAVGVGLVAVGTAVTSVGGGIVAIGLAIKGAGIALTALAGVVSAIGAPVLAVVAGVTALGAGVAYVAHQAGLLGPAFEFLRESFGRVFGTFKETFGGIVNALKSGEMGLAAQIAWAGVKVATLQGAQQVLIGVDHLWKNAGKITAAFFSALGRLVYNAFAAIPKIALAALRGGAALGDVLQGVLAQAFSGESMARALEPAIVRAQAELQARLGANRQRRAPPNLTPPQFQGARIGPPVTMQTPPQQVQGPRPMAQPQQTGGGGPEFGALVGLARRQVQLLGQIAAQGGLA